MRLPSEARSLKTVQVFFSGCLGLEMHLNSANTFIVDFAFLCICKSSDGYCGAHTSWHELFLAGN